MEARGSEVQVHVQLQNKLKTNPGNMITCLKKIKTKEDTHTYTHIYIHNICKHIYVSNYTLWKGKTIETVKKKQKTKQKTRPSDCRGEGKAEQVFRGFLRAVKPSCTIPNKLKVIYRLQSKDAVSKTKPDRHLRPVTRIQESEVGGPPRVEG